MDQAKWQALMDKGERHMRFAIKLYRMQIEHGRWLLHEYPNSATSWRMPEMVRFMEDYKITKTVSHVQIWYVFHRLLWDW